MRVGSVGSVGSIYAPRPVNSIGRPVMRTDAEAVAPAASARGALSGQSAVFFSNSFGDSVEISFDAMQRWFEHSNDNQPPQSGRQQNAHPDSGQKPDLPSPIIDWSMVPDSAYPGLNSNPPANDNAKWNFSVPDFSPGIRPDAAEVGGVKPPERCHTCESRKYVDRSDDSSVSFQTPTHISTNMSAAAVAGHEREHVSNEQSKARREGREIVNQTVTMTYDRCPECGKSYVSGGTTRTTSIKRGGDSDTSAAQPAGTAHDKPA